MSYIKGNYRRSIFTSNQGYVIGLFKVVETDNEEMRDYIGKIVTFTGYFYDLNEEDTYVLYGEAVHHPRYGLQFQAESFEKVKPTEKDAVVEFLASDLFPGIGEKLAAAICDTLGDDPLNEILDNPECLNLVPKLTKKKADKIVSILKKYDESHEIMVRLAELGFNAKESLEVYNNYGNDALRVIDENIYDLRYFKDIPFNKIDRAGLKLNISEDDHRRVLALTHYLMNRLIYQNGDSFLDEEIIVKGLRNNFKIDVTEDEFNKIIDELISRDEVVVDGDDYYLKEIYEAEDYIAERLYIMASSLEKKYDDLDDLIRQMEELYNTKYNGDQIAAIKSAIEKNLLIITGGPGTGKTTIIKAITELYQKVNKFSEEEMDRYLALLAPTGRASRRMSETTGRGAFTIHRFLKWNKDTGEFMINEDNKSSARMVIIDEVSMIDINLFNSLLKGLKSNVKMVLVGDYNQLPSVGPGRLLRDLIESEKIETIYLNKLYRQSENSYITLLASEIRDGDLSDNYLETYGDYTFLKCSSQYIKKNLRNLCEQIKDKGYDYKDYQVLAPMYKGENGIDLLNKELQEVLNPPSELKREYKYGDVVFREGDKVLQLLNMPDDNIYNGDIGIIKYIKFGNTSKSGKTEIYVDFDGNVVKYTPKDLINIKHGFIISIHKSQGSEFPIVVLTVCHSYYRMLYKKLIYTAVTRAKKKLIIIGEPEAFAMSVHNNHEYIRNSKFLEKLVNKFNILSK